MIIKSSCWSFFLQFNNFAFSYVKIRKICNVTNYMYIQFHLYLMTINLFGISFFRIICSCRSRIKLIVAVSSIVRRIVLIRVMLVRKLRLHEGYTHLQLRIPQLELPQLVVVDYSPLKALSPFVKNVPVDGHAKTPECRKWNYAKAATMQRDPRGGAFESSDGRENVARSVYRDRGDSPSQRGVRFPLEFAGNFTAPRWSKGKRKYE